MLINFSYIQITCTVGAICLYFNCTSIKRSFAKRTGAGFADSEFTDFTLYPRFRPSDTVGALYFKQVGETLAKNCEAVLVNRKNMQRIDSCYHQLQQ